MIRTQLLRPVAVHTPLGADVLLLQRAVGQEELSRSFKFELELLSESANIPLEKVAGHRITLRIRCDNQRTRYWNGYVSDFTRCGFDGDLCRYQATMVPWTWFLTKRADCRIFQEDSVPEIVAKVLERYEGLADVDWSLLSRKYSKREYCVQYRESDFNFISRLLEKEGISYFFRHDDNRHTLVLTDAPSGNRPVEGAESLPFRVRRQDGQDVEHVREWKSRRTVQSSAVAYQDYDFSVPSKLLTARAKVKREDGLPGFEIFDYSAGYTDLEHGRGYAKDALEQLECCEETHEAATNCRLLSCGSTLELRGHPDPRQDREYLITRTEFEFGNDEFGSKRLGTTEVAPTEFVCRFQAIDLSRPFRPARSTPVPTVLGSQTAIVTGRPGDEICIDRHSRIKVQFHWDRYGDWNEKSSCWIRVSQPWAGKNYGGLAVPRIGQEVIVDFLEGDPDRPIVTGRVYNGANMPPISGGGRDMRSAKQKANMANALGAARHRDGGRLRFAAEQMENPRVPGHGPVDPAEAEHRIGVSKLVSERPQGGGHQWMHTASGMASNMAGSEQSVSAGSPVSSSVVKPFAMSSTPQVGGVVGGKAAGKVETDSGGEATVEPILPTSVMQSAMMTSIKSNSLGQTGGSNEITMNDTSGNESMFMKAQFDEMHIVGNNREDFVANCETMEVGVDRTRTVGNNEQVTIKNNQNVDVTNNIKVTAGSSIVLECGLSRLSMNSAGVITLSGTMITVAGMANVNVAAPLTNIAGAAMLNLAGAFTNIVGHTVRTRASSLAAINGGKVDLIADGAEVIVQGDKIRMN